MTEQELIHILPWILVPIFTVGAGVTIYLAWRSLKEG